MQRKEYKEIKQTQARMAAEKTRKEAELEHLKKKCDELQMLKFGMLVDLDLLTTSGINHAAEELKDKLAQMQLVHDREVHAIEKEIEDQQAALTDATRQSTALLTSIAALEKEKRDLEKSLNSKQRAVALPPGSLVRLFP